MDPLAANQTYTAAWKCHIHSSSVPAHWIRICWHVPYAYTRCDPVVRSLRFTAGAFLVYPTTMLYPQTLIYVNLFDVLHRGKGELLQGKRYVCSICWTSWGPV